jgi:hypothetical protein
LGSIEWQSPRAYLLWAKDEVVTMEDLNPGDGWQ